MDRSYRTHALPPTTNYRRTSSITRPGVTVSRGQVASMTKLIQSGGMNISQDRFYPSRTTSNRTTYRSEQRSPSRPTGTLLVPVRRARLTSQDPSIHPSSHGSMPHHTEYRYADPKVTVYSITTVPTSTKETEENSTRSKILVADRLSLSPESELIRGGLTGLQNLGNTCFMNSVLQCLSNTKPLLLYVLRNDLENDLNTSSTSVMKGALMQEYAKLIRRMWSTSESGSVISPSSFKNTIGKFAPRFTGYSEQDSQEFLRYLLQGLHEDVNRVQKKPTPTIVDEKEEERMREKDRAKASWKRCLQYDNSRLVEIFAGQLKSTLECSYCGYQSITFDMFWDLSLPLPRNKTSTTLQECLQLFMSKEELTGDEKPTCAKCKQKRPCTKKFSIQKCPEILVLHLKRFSQTRGRSKLSTFVDFPSTNLRLNALSDVMSDSHEGPVPSYNLFGISNHSGTLYSGHYIAQCKHPFTHQWHEFNDGSVHPLEDESGIVSDNVYVLFYEQNKR